MKNQLLGGRLRDRYLLRVALECGAAECCQLISYKKGHHNLRGEGVLGHHK